MTLYSIVSLAVSTASFLLSKTCFCSRKKGEILGNKDLPLEKIQIAYRIFKDLGDDYSKAFLDNDLIIKKISSSSFKIILPITIESQTRHVKTFYKVHKSGHLFHVAKQQKIIETISDFPLNLLKMAYKEFKKMHPATTQSCGLLSIPKTRFFYHIAPTREFNIRWWDHQTFLINMRGENPIAQGSFKQVKSACKVAVILSESGKRFDVSEMVRIIDQKNIVLEKRINFLNPIFNGLNHPNVLIPQKENVRYRANKNSQLFLTERAHSDLQTFIENNKIKEECFYSISKQIISGISYLHYNNIIHRDIKSENVIVFFSENGGDPIAKITDLDSAKRPHEDPVSYMPCQSLYCLPLNLRHKIVVITRRAIFDQDLLNYPRLWPIHGFTYRESVKTDRNSMGIMLSFLYLSFIKKNKIFSPSEKQTIFENLLLKLSGYHIRNEDGISALNLNFFSKKIDADLFSKTQEEAEKMLDNCISLEEAIRAISRIL